MSQAKERTCLSCILVLFEIEVILYCKLEAKFAYLFSRSFLLLDVFDKPHDVAELGSPRLEQLEVMGCKDLRIVALCNDL
jgi:hypothetical protein